MAERPIHQGVSDQKQIYYFNKKNVQVGYINILDFLEQGITWPQIKMTQFGKMAKINQLDTAVFGDSAGVSLYMYI